MPDHNVIELRVLSNLQCRIQMCPIINDYKPEKTSNPRAKLTPAIICHFCLLNDLSDE